MFAAALLVLAMNFSGPKHTLKDFVGRPQKAFAWSRVPGEPQEFRLTSQSWQGAPWIHDLVIQEPKGAVAEHGIAFLVVTGDRVGRVDLPFGQSLADRSGLPVATLFNVPNQPLYELREDDLIAYTFQRYLEGADLDWPLLLPMANSVVRAMDMIQQETKGEISRFIVTGESKRGWTTWLVGTLSDPRVVGIAPVAFDNLDFERQLKYQVQSWGHLSEMLGSYSGAGLIGEMDSEQGTRLREMVDPIFSVSEIHIPVLSIRGANDPYWAADAANLYWPKVRPPKGFLVLPNEGHDFMNDESYLTALAAFPREIKNHRLLEVETSFSGTRFECRWGTPVQKVLLWRAESATKDFRSSHWQPVEEVAIEAGRTRLSVETSVPKSGFAAYFVEFVRPDGPLTSTVQIVGH